MLYTLYLIFNRFIFAPGIVPAHQRRDGSYQPIEKLRGFLNYERNPEPYRKPLERLLDWEELNPVEGDDEKHSAVERKVQAARCMDCGTPFCQTDTGCPVSNIIPEWNSLVYNGQWADAIERLHKTNNFPEFTGRVCPAPCEGSSWYPQGWTPADKMGTNAFVTLSKHMSSDP